MMTQNVACQAFPCRSPPSMLRLSSISTAAAGNLPDAENGRYTLSPVTDGVIRLDTRTGEVSTCSNRGNGWACYAVPDERAALDSEIGRLQVENEKLARRGWRSRSLIVSGKIDDPLAEVRSAEKVRSRRLPIANARSRFRESKFPLPSDRDMDRAMSFLDQAWRRLVEMANRVQKDVNGRI